MAALDCANESTPVIYYMAVVGIDFSEPLGTFDLQASNNIIGVELQERTTGTSATRTVATSGTVTISSYSVTRIAGSFSVQFPGFTGMTRATFDFDPCD